MLASRHEIEAAAPIFAEARANAIKLGDSSTLAILHIYIAEAEGKRGLVRSARTHARTALSLLASHPNVWLEAWAEHTSKGRLSAHMLGRRRWI